MFLFTILLLSINPKFRPSMNMTNVKKMYFSGQNEKEDRKTSLKKKNFGIFNQYKQA